MGPIVRIEGPQLEMVLSTIKSSEERIGRGGIYRMRFAIDDGGVKIKINEGVWSPPLGDIQ